MNHFKAQLRKPNFSNKRTRIYFLDDNGYVLFGFDEQNQFLKENLNEQTDLLLAEYDSELFENLIDHSIYRRIKIFDYQGICEQKKEVDSDSSSGFSLNAQPKLIKFLFKSVLTAFNEFSFFISFWLSLFVKPVHSLQEDESVDGYYIAALPKRIQIESCRKDFIFYELNKSILTKEPKLNSFKRQNSEQDYYIIYKIPKTNLILVITSDEYEPIKKAYIPNIVIEKSKCDRDTFHRRPPYMYKGPVCYPNSEVSNYHCFIHFNFNFNN